MPDLDRHLAGALPSFDAVLDRVLHERLDHQRLDGLIRQLGRQVDLVADLLAERHDRQVVLRQLELRSEEAGLVSSLVIYR